MVESFLQFSGIVMQFSDVNTEDPNCVLMGDAEDNFTYESMNAAFRVLYALRKPLIVTLGCGFVFTCLFLLDAFLAVSFTNYVVIFI